MIKINVFYVLLNLVAAGMYLMIIARYFHYLSKVSKFSKLYEIEFKDQC